MPNVELTADLNIRRVLQQIEVIKRSMRNTSQSALANIAGDNAPFDTQGKNWATFGGKEMGIAKTADAFGQMSKQIREAKKEAKELAAVLVKGMSPGTGGGIPHTAPRSVGAFTDAMLRQHAKNALAMGQLIPGPIPFTDAMLRQHAKNALAMGPLSISGLPVGTGKPPVIPKAAGINWSLAALGAVSSVFSPWMGARLLNQAFGGGTQGGQGGGGSGAGGLTKGIFGQGGMMGFGVWYTLINAVQIAAKAIARLGEEAIQSGAKLFQRAARTGLPTGKLGMIEAIFTGVGLSPDLAEKFLEQRHGAMSGGRSFSVSGEMMRASGAFGQSAEMNQIRNMSKQIFEFEQRAAGLFDTISRGTPAMQDLFMDVEVLKLQFQALGTQIVQDLGSEIKAVIMTIGEFAHIMYGVAKWMARFFHLGPVHEYFQRNFPVDTTQPGTNQMTAGRRTASSASSFERIGFVISPFRDQANAHLRKIEQNTKKMADSVTHRRDSRPPEYITPYFVPHGNGI